MQPDLYGRIEALRGEYDSMLTRPDQVFLARVEAERTLTPKDDVVLARMEAQAALRSERGADVYLIAGKPYDSDGMADLVLEQARRFAGKTTRGRADRAALRSFRTITTLLSRGRRLSAEQTVALELIVGHYAKEAELVTV